MKFHVWQSRGLLGRRWRWHLRARNGEIVAHGQGYHYKADALHAVELVRSASGAAIHHGL